MSAQYLSQLRQESESHAIKSAALEARRLTIEAMISKHAARGTFLETEIRRLESTAPALRNIPPPFALRTEDERGHYSFLMSDYSWCPAEDLAAAQHAGRQLLTFKQWKRICDLRAQYGGIVVHAGTI